MRWTLALMVALCTHLGAQGYLYSPPGTDKVEGFQFSDGLGWFADGRYEFIEGELRGTPRSFSEAAYRLDSREHTPVTAAGRTWTTVSLHVAHADYDKVASYSRFGVNALDTPTQVFLGKVTWPSVSGMPTVNTPTPWGGPNGSYRFPFSKPWSYDGKRDFLLDYQFHGGTMANNSGWGNNIVYKYFFDGDTDYPNQASHGATTPFPLTLPRCTDSSITVSAGATAQIFARAYGSQYQEIEQRNKLHVGHFSVYTAPNALVMHIIGFAGHQDGLLIPYVRCNKLYVDISKPFLAYLYQTMSGSYYSTRSPTMNHYLPPKQIPPGGEIWIQAAWDDSKTGYCNLSQAMRVKVPKPPPSQIRRRTLLASYCACSTYGVQKPYVIRAIYARYAFK